MNKTYHACLYILEVFPTSHSLFRYDIAFKWFLCMWIGRIAKPLHIGPPVGLSSWGGLLFGLISCPLPAEVSNDLHTSALEEVCLCPHLGSSELVYCKSSLPTHSPSTRTPEEADKEKCVGFWLSPWCNLPPLMFYLIFLLYLISYQRG